MRSEMPLWAKAVSWTVGVVNIALAVRGINGMLYPVHRVLTGYRPHADTPYFGIVFVVMTVINISVLALFVVAAFQLFRLKPSGLLLHSIASVLLFIYFVLNGVLWLVPDRIGASIGAATGVGNMGIAPFVLLFLVPGVYPISSTIVLQFARRKITVTQASS